MSLCAEVRKLILLEAQLPQKAYCLTAGGIRDAELARKLIAAGATRIAASDGVKIVQQARHPQPFQPPNRPVPELTKEGLDSARSESQESADKHRTK